MSLKSIILFTAILLFVGCRTPRTPSTMADYSGLYKYVSPHEYQQFSLPWLRLTEAGVYTEFEDSPPNQERPLKRGLWRLVAGVNPQIALDQDYYPIEQSGSGIRIVLNDDRGQYYERVK